MPLIDKEQRRLYNSAYRNRPEYSELRWKRWLKSWYNISLEEYTQFLEDQDGGCAICGKTEEENGRRLAVDHDHSCCPGRRSCGACIRGVLCDNCNRGIGLFKDNKELLLLAVEYIG